MNNFYKSNSKEANGGFIYFLMIFTFLLTSLIGQAILIACKISEGSVFNVVNSLFSTFAIGVCLLYASKLDNNNFRKVCVLNKFDKKYLLLSLILSIGMFCGLGFVNYAVANLFTLCGLNVSSVSISLNSVGDLIIFSVCLSVFPAIFEEFFFRGALLSYAKGKGYKVVLVLSLFFAIYHGNLVQFFYQFIYGFALCLLAIKAKSVWPGVVSHFINNFLVILLTYLRMQINFFNPLLILMGISLLGAFVILLIFYRREENPFTIELKGESSLSSFWLPFGVIGVILMTALALLGLIP